MSVPTLSSGRALNNQGVLGSNLNGTPRLVGFPTTSTGTSQGTYQHLGITGEPALKTTFLNASASQAGGFQFYTASSTNAPEKILDVTTQAVQAKKLILANNNNELSATGDELTIRDTTATSVTRFNSNQLKLGVDALNSFISLDNGGHPSLKILDRDANEAILSSIDLTFNSVSLVSTVATNSTDIATNSTDIATNASNIASNTTAIENLQNTSYQTIVPQLVFSSPAVYADSVTPPATNSTWQTTYGVFGWYFQNSSGGKNNYYFPAKNDMIVQDLKGLYYEMFNNCLNVGDMPFFTIYTVPTGNNDYRPWYHSAYTVTPTANSLPNQMVQCFANLQNLSSEPDSWAIPNKISMLASPFQPIKGDYQLTDKVLFVAFGTNSASAINACEFSVLKVGMITSGFSNEFLLM